MQFGLFLLQLKLWSFFEMVNFFKMSLLHFLNSIWGVFTCVLKCWLQTIYDIFILPNIFFSLRLTISLELSKVFLQFLVLKLYITKLHFEFFRVIYIFSVVGSMFQGRLVIKSTIYDSGYARREDNSTIFNEINELKYGACFCSLVRWLL